MPQRTLQQKKTAGGDRVRIEIDPDLQRALDQLKAKEPTISGSRGYVETIRFLADYYTRHKPMEELLVEIRRASTGFIQNLDVNLQMSLERVMPKAAARVVANLLTVTSGTAGDAQQPLRTADPAGQQLRK